MLLKKTTIAIAMTASTTLLSLPYNAFAGEGNGLIEMVQTTSDGLLIFRVQQHTNKPSCVPRELRDFSINATTAAGKLNAALVLSAYLNVKAVTAIGTGSCTGDRETLSTIWTN